MRFGTASGDEFSLQPFGFSTKRSDFASGLVYFGYRFYVPHLGRWLNRDPLQEEGGINLYAYVNGDPMGYVDPDGRFVWVPIVIGGINGGLGSWVQGGGTAEIITGVVVGGGLGWLIPTAPPALVAGLGNAAGQLVDLTIEGKPRSCFNYGAVLGAGYAGLYKDFAGATFGYAQLDFMLTTTGTAIGAGNNRNCGCN